MKTSSGLAHVTLDAPLKSAASDGVGLSKRQKTGVTWSTGTFSFVSNLAVDPGSRTVSSTSGDTCMVSYTE